MPKRGHQKQAPLESGREDPLFPTNGIDEDHIDDLSDDSEELSSTEEEISDTDDIEHAMLDMIQPNLDSDPFPEENEGYNGMNSVPESCTDDEEQRELEKDVDPGSDSSEDEGPVKNTVGKVPLQWYKDEDHIGYDQEGQKIIKKGRKDKLDVLLDRNDSKTALRTIYDEYNDEEIVLSKEEIAMLLRIRRGQFPHVEVNPYQPYEDFFTREQEIHPLGSGPEPKRRFMPSKWEEKKIVKLVRAIRKGWLKVGEKKAPEQPPAYLLWADDGQTTEKTASGLSYIPAAKPKLPGHEESYNPSAEYIPTEEEKSAWALLDPEDRPTFVPQAYSALRLVPAYADFIKERFERCLDLYLCPRVRKKRLNIDPEELVPKLPKPQDLQPFPTTMTMRYEGHKGKVRTVSPDASGQWLLSGGDDGTVRLWEVTTGRCVRHWSLGEDDEGVVHVSWQPGGGASGAGGCGLVAAVVGKRLVVMWSGVGGAEQEGHARETLEASTSSSASNDGALCHWRLHSSTHSVGPHLELTHKFPVKHVAWHHQGDYFATTCPTGATQAVLVHRLSQGSTQNPFRKAKGRMMRCAFHPNKPFFFVATQNHVRVYNLAKQALAKKLIGSSGVTTCLAVHPSGDHILVGGEDRRLAWYDMDLSTKPYKALRYHQAALRGAAFHRTYPLFASASDDGTVHVFHGMVYSDLLTNPLVVPLKILRGHQVVDHAGVLDCAFHPTQPWVFTAGADSFVHLYCN